MKLFVLILLWFPAFLFAQTKFESVEQLFVQKQYVKAQEIMTEYVSSNPDDLRGIELLGDAYGYQKKWDDAIICYKKLVDQDS